MITVPNDKKLIFFDGVCNLCNASINYVIKHDKKNSFLFAPLQSEAAKKFLSNYSVDQSEMDSIVLFDHKNGISTKSTAALRIAKGLSFPINLSVVFFIIPTSLRNIVYNYIAKNRYRWYGKREECMVPTPELSEKFLK